jgi:hypothetical protein
MLTLEPVSEEFVLEEVMFEEMMLEELSIYKRVVLHIHMYFTIV